MFTLFLREFKAVFRNIKSIIALGVLALCSGIFFVRNNLMTGYSEIELVLSSLTLIIALVTPLVAIFSVAKERKEESYTFIEVLPFTRMTILLGKFLGVFAACLVPLSTVAIYPVVISLMGAKSVLGSYVSVIVLYAMTAFLCAFGLLMAYLCRRTWLAIVTVYVPLTALLFLGTFSTVFECSSLVALVFFICLSLAIGVCFGLVSKRITIGALMSLLGVVGAAVTYLVWKDVMVNSIAVFLELISPFRRFDSLVFGLFDLSGLVFYVSLCIVLLWATAIAMKPRRRHLSGKRRAPANIRTASAVATVIVVCIIINVLVCAVPAYATKIDISDNKLYTTSNGVNSFLKSLDQNVTVFMIDEGGADERVVEYVERYCSMSDKIVVKKVNTQKDTKFLDRYNLEGQTLSPCSIIVESASRWKLVSSEEYFAYYHEKIGYMSPSEYEYSLGVYTEMYSQYASYLSEEELSTLEDIIVSLSQEAVLCFCAEQSLTEAIEYVSADYVPTVYFLSGRGEKNTSANPLDINGLTRIPDDVGLLIINAPDRDYNDSDISVLLEYTERGGRIIAIVNKANQDMPNLTRFLACYGLSFEGDAITDDKIKAISNTSDGTEVTLVGASAIKTLETSDATVEPLLTFDVEQDTESGESKKVTKNVAVVAYKGEQPVVALITGADTFNGTGVDTLDEAEQEEYLVAFSFLQSIRNGIKKNFESSVSVFAPRIYATEAIDASSSVGFFGALFIGIIPLVIIAVPLVITIERKKRTSSK